MWDSHYFLAAFVVAEGDVLTGVAVHTAAAVVVVDGVHVLAVVAAAHL